MAFNSVVDRIIRYVPAHNFNKNHEKFIEWCGKRIRSPEQRLLLGVTALAIQPAIDLNNKKVDEDTRKVSCARTAAKIIIGTITGFGVRDLCIRFVNSHSKMGEEANKAIHRLFTPSTIKIDIKSSAYKQYRNALGTFLAIGVMLITNFAIDAPVTQILTNYFTKKMKNKAQEVANDKT